MLKQQLKEAALKFFTIPSQYELCIDDVENENATFLWKDAASDEGYYVELDKHGKLLSLSQPAMETDVRISIEEQERIAKQFLTSQYAEALDYYTLSKITENEGRTRFRFEQFVGGIPLDSYYCFIEIASNGQILDFNFRGYTKNPPSFPETLVQKEKVLAKLLEAEWTVSMSYLSSDYYSVPASGLYVIYESPIVYSKFDASTGVDSLASKRENNEELEHEVFVPMPTVEPHIPKETIEDIVGVTPSMEIVRQVEIDQDKQGIVWREKGWQPPNDKSMNSFIQDRFEHTVKATIKLSTNELKGFIWFKERTGDLDLTFEECQNIAVSFITTYYREYVPYLQMKLEDPSFNELHRAFFTFPITVDGYRMDGESFVMSVNKTTGFIDMLMTPKIEVSTMQAYTPASLLALPKVKPSLKEIDAVLQWASNYDGDEETEQLNYTFIHHQTKQRIKGINAITGELILKDF